MTTLGDFLYDSLGAPESLDLVGVGAAAREYDNQWLYRMNKGLSEASEVENVEDYWLGLEDDPTRDYDLRGDVFEYDFEDDILSSEASMLVAPKPSIYRGAALEDRSYVSNYVRMAETLDNGLDGVLMRQVAEDIESFPNGLDIRTAAENFRKGFKTDQLSRQGIDVSDLTKIIHMQEGLDATEINWRPENWPAEDMIFVQKKR